MFVESGQINLTQFQKPYHTPEFCPQNFPEKNFPLSWTKNL